MPSSNDGRTWVKVRQPGPLARPSRWARLASFDSAGLDHALGLPRWQHLDHVLRGLRHHRPVSHRPGPGPATIEGIRNCFPSACLGRRRRPGADMLDQEERLIEIHSLLIALQPGNAPGAYRAGELSLGLELISSRHRRHHRREAADHRLRSNPCLSPPAAGDRAPRAEDFRAFVGLAYIPPIKFNEVSSQSGGPGSGTRLGPRGPALRGIRGYVVVARSQSPVTEATTRDRLDTVDFRSGPGRRLPLSTSGSGV